MAIPNTKVYVQFDIEASTAAFFTLDDPVQGVLDGIYGLGGDVLEDVTQFVAGISFDRGKSLELDRFNSGTLKVIFHNDNRWFDPFFTDSPYFEQIVPKRQVVITSNGVTQFVGFIDDIDLEYNLGNTKSYASISCSDSFAQLASTGLDAFTNTAQYSGERINAILSRPEVGWPVADRNIDTGQQFLQADVVAENTNTLQYLQLVESSEPGALFIGKDGRVTFKDRVNLPSPSGALLFSDDYSGINYDEVSVTYGSENLYNHVVITRANGTAQTADSTTSQAIYGVQALNQDGLLMDSDADALTLAEFLINKYELPELRFQSVGMTLEDKTSSVQNDLLALEINDIVQIKFTPNGIGDPIIENAIITGISHDIGINSHLMKFQFGEITGYPFIIEDPTYGILAGDGYTGYPLAFWS
jgi:hypothetical protein